MKIICESCETVFKAEVVKGMTNCPVCGAAFDGGGEEEREEEGSLMYFSKIWRFNSPKEQDFVSIYCRECGETQHLHLKYFNKLVDKKYVILQSAIVVKCQGCGKEHKPRKILYKEKDYPNTLHLPHCPICNSTMLKKITLTSKVMATATLGIFANPHNSKTYECINCGYKF